VVHGRQVWIGGLNEGSRLRLIQKGMNAPSLSARPFSPSPLSRRLMGTRIDISNEAVKDEETYNIFNSISSSFKSSCPSPKSCHIVRDDARVWKWRLERSLYVWNGVGEGMERIALHCFEDGLKMG